MLARIKAAAAAVLHFALNVEPAAVAGAVAAVVALVAGVRTGHLSLGLVTAALAAVQALFTRSRVTPAFVPDAPSSQLPDVVDPAPDGATS